MRRMRHSPPPSNWSGTAFSGINFGSVVIMVRPAADWGSSSRARRRASSFSMAGSTSCSMNCLMRVLLPVRTGPTTPIKISPPVRAPISRQTVASNRSCFSKMVSSCPRLRSQKQCIRRHGGIVQPPPISPGEAVKIGMIYSSLMATASLVRSCASVVRWGSSSI